MQGLFIGSGVLEAGCRTIGKILTRIGLWQRENLLINLYHIRQIT
jgi:hypothetical protein